MIAQLRDLEVIILDHNANVSEERFHKDIVSFIQTQYSHFQRDRRVMEQLWLVTWASYLGSREAIEYVDNQILRNVGNVKTDWRHKTQVGKAFETVETLHSYFMQAFFPSQNWFALRSKYSDNSLTARLLEYYLSHKMDDWNFKQEFSAYLKQLIVCGTSVLALPWSDQNIKFEVLDIFDCFFNPREASIETSPFIRRLMKTRAELIEGVQSGFYNHKLSLKDIIEISNTNTFGEVYSDLNSTRFKKFQGIDTQDYSFTDKVVTLEYWGEIHLPYAIIKNCMVHVVAENILRLEKNTYKAGKPFIVGSYIPVIRQAYGLGALQSSLGMLTQINNTINQMLDGTELALNPMYTIVQDQVIDPEDVFSEPGKKIPVESHDALKPVMPPTNNFNLSYQQVQYLEQMVNQNVGLGPLLGVGQPRGGERVTKAEIDAVIAAGGNRQTGVYSHIQTNSLLPILRKTVGNTQQFWSGYEQIEFEDTTTHLLIEAEIDKNTFDFDFDIEAKGSEHVAQREELAARRSSILQLALQLPPEIQQTIDLTALFLDIVDSTLYENASKYLLPPPQEPEVQEATLASSPAQEQFLQEQLLADGGQNLFQEVFRQQLPGEISNGTTNTATTTTGAEATTSAAASSSASGAQPTA